MAQKFWMNTYAKGRIHELNVDLLVVVYTDTDTVSVRVPYWHCVSTAHTQN